MRFRKGHEVLSNLDFGPVVMQLGITVKKEACQVVETLGWKKLFKLQATKEFQKMSPKKLAQFLFLEFSKL
jgi:hypothetical protein